MLESKGISRNLLPFFGFSIPFVLMGRQTPQRDGHLLGMGDTDGSWWPGGCESGLPHLEPQNRLPVVSAVVFKDSNHPFHLLPWVWCHQHGSGGAAEEWQEGPGSLGEAGAASVPADCCKAALLACKAASSWAIVKQGTFLKKTYVVCFKLLIDYCLYDYI